MKKIVEISINFDYVGMIEKALNFYLSAELLDHILVSNILFTQYLDSTNETQFALLRQRSNIVDGLKWCSVPWQFMQGAAYPPNDKPLPWDCRHVAAGHHKHLNQFLARFIADNDLLA